MKKPSQNDDVLMFILEHGSITQSDAVKFGCYRLAARVSDLRRMGIPLISKMEKVKKRNGKTAMIARYRLKEGE